MFEHPVGSVNNLEPLKIRQLRVKLLFEELVELAEAGDVKETMVKLCEKHLSESYPDNGQPLMDGDNVNLIEELDAISDLQYVLDGKKITSGLFLVTDEAFELVHENNMSKAHRDRLHVNDTCRVSGITKFNVFEKDGKFLLYNESGKLIKPHDHKKVDLSNLVPETPTNILK